MAQYSHVIDALKGVQQRISQIQQKTGSTRPINLVAVSKTKPAEIIKACYDAGHRHFGENYVQELIDKSKELPQDIKWHFIGHLQSNKCKNLLEVKNIHMVESVDSLKLAKTLSKHYNGPQPLNIMVQINTSGETNKGGINPGQCVEVVQWIQTELRNLKFCGLMTIGSVEASNSTTENPDFKCLLDCRKQLVTGLSMEEELIDLSMGMSSDYEMAVQMGSTNVRVGSTIFGAREYNK
ncbi:hypothetical protein PROFUN_15189 [Planoprotostelium fungivorum]|uniref:Pyridoxal phosphate homeostasis protein n=1 Tax=Planoprotostelium fungivorum TaxID=1890364 RepID=A0A2P6MXS6_9EUKA|nr:hypothetical protein PROFUN_15189 [Planoprotostelium fungivorum]